MASKIFLSIYGQKVVGGSGTNPKSVNTLATTIQFGPLRLQYVVAAFGPSLSFSNHFATLIDAVNGMLLYIHIHLLAGAVVCQILVIKGL